MFKIKRDSLLIIAGPCVIESAEQCLAIARHVKGICDRLGFTYIFKASFDKANRSSGSSFRGPGVEDGLVVLKVPAFLARQTDLLVACARTGRTVNVKKGQFMSPAEMGNAVEKIRSVGGKEVLLTERGTFFGYNRLVNDFLGLPQMQSLGCPVVFDITHSTQQPAGLGSASGGQPQYSPMLAHAAVAAGVDGLFLECHPDPKHAKSDAASVLDLAVVDKLLTQCKQLADLRAGW